MENDKFGSPRVPALWIAFLLMTIIPGRSALALDPQKAVTQYSHNVWQNENGLPQNSALAIVQTADGYLWFGTNEGVARFDGMRFTVFDKTNTKEMRHNRVATLCEGKDGSLWIGTFGGLTRLKDGRCACYTTENGLSNNFVNSVFDDGKGSVWIGTDSGLNRLKDGRFTIYTTREGLAGNTVFSLGQGQDGSLWIGTSEGLTRFKDGRHSIYTTNEGLPHNLVSAIYGDRKGNMWIGTNGGLCQFKNERFVTYTTKDGLSSNTVSAIREDRDGNLWIGTRGGGLNRFRDGEFASYTAKEGLSNDIVESIFEDREGSLWIGTSGGGVNRLRDGKFTAYTAAGGLFNDNVNSISEDPEGAIWIGGPGGISRLKEGKLISYTTRNGLPDNRVLPICAGKEGSIWIGTTGGGLMRFKNGKFTTYTSQHGLSNDFVKAIYEDKEGDVWIGTENGLSRLIDGRFVNYTTKEGLSNSKVYSLHEGRDGVLWIGTKGGGLNRFKDGRFTVYTTREGLSDDVVYSLYEDRDGVLWIGTRGGGLNRFKEGVFTSYTTKSGMFDDAVFQILEDRLGNLWMSCNKGIYRVSKRVLDDFAQGKVSSIRCVSYGVADGMRTSECNGGNQPAGWKSRDGRLWFATIKGAVVIDPSHTKINAVPPPVIIERAIIDEKTAVLDEEAQFAPGKGELEFHYTGLSYLAPEKVLFKYKLEGFNKDWVDAGTRRDAYYTNIPPGKYRFRVIACNNDGVWNEAGASFLFHLKPFFYQTPFFYVLCGAGLVLMGVGSVRFRVRRLQARARQLTLLVDERTRDLRENQGKLVISEKMASLGRLTAGIAHEMNTPLAAVRAALSEVEQLVGEYQASIDSPAVTPADHREIATDLLRSARVAESAAARAAEFVHSIKSQTRSMAEQQRMRFDIVPVIADALLLLTHALKKANCTVSFEHPESVEVYSVPRYMAQILTNLVTNSIDASASNGGAPIEVRLTTQDERVELEVKDQGCGIAEEHLGKIFDPMFTSKPFGQSTGLGLSIIHDIIYGELGGTISVSTQVGQGTVFTVTFPNALEAADGPKIQV